MASASLDYYNYFPESPQRLCRHVGAGQVLNLGCGLNQFHGWVNLDRTKVPGVHHVHDLETTPLPFDDDEFDGIFASHVLEHVVNLHGLVLDLLRISKNGATWEVHVPVGLESLEVLDHKRIVTEETFRNWYATHPTLDATVARMRWDGAPALELVEAFYNRTFELGPISSYHFRKYLGMEPPGRPIQKVIILRVVK